MFGSTPPGILILDVILAVMTTVLAPILFGIFKRLGTITTQIESTITLQSETIATLGDVVKELNNTRVRDAELEGRIKGLYEKVTQLEVEFRSQQR